MDGLVQERYNYIANALKLQVSCPNPLVLWNMLQRINSWIHIMEDTIFTFQRFTDNMSPNNYWISTALGPRLQTQIN